VSARRQFVLRALLAITHDLGAAAVAWTAAFWLRFNLEIPGEYLHLMLVRLPWVIAISAAVFWSFGLYRGVWRYASLPDLQRILVAVGVAALAVPAAFSFFRVGYEVPRSVYLIAPVLLMGAMSGSRLLYRAWKEGRLLGLVRHPEAAPVLVLGAGRAASALLRDLTNSGQWRVVALLDDNARLHGASIQGVKVLGPLTGVGDIAQRFGVTQAVIAMPGASHAARKRAVNLCVAAGLSVMTVPAYSDIVSGKVSVSALRNVELDDLLGRDPVRLDDAGLHQMLQGKRVLVTGAGGSIGAELCRQIARFAPKQVILFDISEFALYSIEQEFRDRMPKVQIAAVLGDVKDRSRVTQVFEKYQPHTVFHAAAYKHVPLTENENTWEAVCNNVLGTRLLCELSIRFAAEKLVFVSTDKAVNPTNVMGASKRLAEMVCQAMQRESATRIVIVRFGNVLGSSGSVIPRFRKQIAEGGPITVTHPEITRYFMSIPEAAQLVIQAGAMGNGGEIYVLEMGDPVKIVDLARDMIRLSGFSEDDIEIEFTGLRPGEKLYEEPLASGELTLATHHPKLRIARSRTAAPNLMERLDAWFAPQRSLSDEEVREQLRRWIPEYEVRQAIVEPVGNLAGKPTSGQV
jgi:FlaA1/EpsC-like NDP-sugar epimerase